MILARGLWVLTLGAALAGTFAYWWLAGRPQDLDAAPARKFACVSYTPFRGSESPFDPTLIVPPERIEEDLVRLAAVTDCVRTYATDQGLAAVPEIVDRLGLQVLLGVWIGREAALNRLQLDTAIALARAHPDAIRGIVVGNEVLLRGEQSAATLAKLLREVKAATGLPVTYADVWEFWIRAPAELAEAADFITIHILPYWEDRPVAAHEAITHLGEVLDEVEAAFPGKPIFIGETGWPSAGRTRGPSVPAPFEQARYIREFLAYAAARGLDYNLIEAFDQPWKRLLEGTVGGHWGLLDTDRQEKFPLVGPVSNDPRWAPKAIAAMLLGLLLLVLQAGPLRRSEPRRAVLLPPAAMAAGTLLVLAGEHSYLAARNSVEFTIEAALLLLSGVTAWSLLRQIADPAPRQPLAIAAFADNLGALPGALLDPARRLALLQILAVSGALCASLALVFDARYRDFPVAAFFVPALGFALEALFRRDWLQDASDRAEEALFSALLLGSAGWILLSEGIQNLSALAWVGIAILLALPWIGAWRGVIESPRAPAIAAAAR